MLEHAEHTHNAIMLEAREGLGLTKNRGLGRFEYLRLIRRNRLDCLVGASRNEINRKELLTDTSSERWSARYVKSKPPCPSGRSIAYSECTTNPTGKDGDRIQ
jgi:hypothetical protein